MSEAQPALAGHEVAAWLRRHPQFLQQYPDLAMSLVVPRQDGPAASLVGYQLEILREKNRDLSRRLHELASNAQVNEQLTLRTHQLTLALMRQANAADTLRAMAAALAEDFAGDQVSIVLFKPVAGLDQAAWLQVIAADDPRLAVFADALASGEPVCGRLLPARNEVLYGEQAGQVQSSVLLPLPGIGLLAVGSTDGNRFYPGMGTVFVHMMAQSLLTALARFV
ncbi:hypothetical protein ABB30_04190 [Stenotrophomonas ginsengisoli]|uniref:Phytochrome sensor protein n=1 Tax=Stenotrophomonas ginsengisoli TaxID=336566 RepID=A0A0R0D7D3_9GAMM|nr:DUF484 family protein [Stenotrophomonas ginsengisoli]KRG78265.1 hypothetical protein ABB30_04190 [Stenotrophomonas ginsengisoli]